MKTICLYFQIHQPFRLRNFPFFEIGEGKNYFDEELNSSIMRQEALNSYLPINRLLLKLILDHKKKFNLSFCISGTALEQFEKYAPEVIESFQELSDTGCVEFVGDTYSHSLAALKSRGEFARQVKAHSEKINELFGVIPMVFKISQLSYTDAIGEILYDIGFDTVILEGNEKLWGNSAVNHVYRSAIIPGLKLLVNNRQLSDDITLRFSDTKWQEFPLTAEKYIDWLMMIPDDEQLINLFLDYGKIGNIQQNGLEVFEFLDKFVEVSLASGFQLNNPSLLEPLNSEAPSFSLPIVFSSGKNSQNEIMCCLGNDMQQEAIYTLYELEYLVLSCHDSSIKRDWIYLQSCDHFYYMCTTNVSSGSKFLYFSPYETPFSAFINFMNVLADFRKRAKTSKGNLPKSKQEIAENKIVAKHEIFQEPGYLLLNK